MIRLKIYAAAVAGFVAFLVAFALKVARMTNAKRDAEANQDRLDAIESKRKETQDAENQSDSDLIDSISK